MRKQRQSRSLAGFLTTGGRLSCRYSFSKVTPRRLAQLPGLSFREGQDFLTTGGRVLFPGSFFEITPLGLAQLCRFNFQEGQWTGTAGSLDNLVKHDVVGLPS